MGDILQLTLRFMKQNCAKRVIPIVRLGRNNMNCMVGKQQMYINELFASSVRCI